MIAYIVIENGIDKDIDSLSLSCEDEVVQAAADHSILSDRKPIPIQIDEAIKYFEEHAFTVKTYDKPFYSLYMTWGGVNDLSLYRTLPEAIKQAQSFFKRYSDLNGCEDRLEALYANLNENPFVFHELEDMFLKIQKEGDE